MPKLEYRGILARPGAYKYKWGVEKKTFEELKKAFQRTPELMLTLGHPRNPDGTPRIPNKEDYLGRVVAVVNEEKQRIDGIFKFHDEEWDKLPEHVRELLLNDESVAISMGYPPPKIENGEQKDIVFDHTALIVNGESPICPLGECGVNIRLESEDGEYVLMQYEQSTETKDSEKPAVEDEAAKKSPDVATVTVADFDRFKESLITSVKELLQPQEPAGANPEEEVKSEPEEQAPVTPPPEPTLEPARAFPAGKAETGSKLPFLKKDGSVEVPLELYLGKTKNKGE